MKNYKTRISILSNEEIENLYSIPIFNTDCRHKYFTLDIQEERYIDSLRFPNTKINFILLLGYFKAKKQFFNLENKIDQNDIQYIREKYYIGDGYFTTDDISKNKLWVFQQKILDLFEYKLCDTEYLELLSKNALQTARLSSKSIFIFKKLLNILKSDKIVIPAYSTMQDIVRNALVEEQNRLAELAKIHITKEIDLKLDELFKKDGNQYLVTQVKKEPKDFSYKEIKQEIEKQKLLKPLYKFGKKFLSKIEISNENIKYYASMIDYYSVARIKRFKSEIVKIYLFCYINLKYKKINDNLVNTLIYFIRKYEDTAKFEARSKVYELKIENSTYLNKASKVLNLFIDKKIPDSTPFGEVKSRAFDIIEKDKLKKLSNYIGKVKIDDIEFEWEHIEKLSKKFKKNIRRIIENIDFCSTNKSDLFLKALMQIREFSLNKKRVSIHYEKQSKNSVVPNNLSKYLLKKELIKINNIYKRVYKVIPDRFEFYIYLLLKKHLDSGDIYLNDSIRHQSYDSDLVSDEVMKNKENIIKSIRSDFIGNPIKLNLENLKYELEGLYINVNRRIVNGENEYIKLTGTEENIKWKLPYTKSSDTVNHPFYEKLPQIEIKDLLLFVEERCKYMNTFTHALNKYVKKDFETNALIGCIIAFGTNKGLLKMADSSNLNYQTLVSTANNYVRLETLKEANDIISNTIFKLPIFEYYNIDNDIIHSSSDGQKFETKINTINARYSPKYFGLKKGISSYTMVANHVPVNAKMIGTNEHESHYVFDIIYNNTSDIQPDLHSVDSHGTNNVNFILLHAFDYIFAPRFKDINGKTETLYGFKSPKEYKNSILKPIRKIDENLIIQEWPNIQKIFISLALKVTTQNIIIGKLSSYARKNRTKKALWELDNIVRSIYVLTYIDILFLRQNVQRALNRNESYHQLRRAIPYENQGKFKVKTEEEQQILGECSRLIANCIIYYNSYILSDLMLYSKSKRKNDWIELIKKISPVAWQHVNLSGCYDFSSSEYIFDINEIIITLENSFPERKE